MGKYDEIKEIESNEIKDFIFKDLKGIVFDNEILKALISQKGYKTKEEIIEFDIAKFYETKSGIIKITKIGENVFKNCNNLKKVTLPNTIKKIEKKAFFNCKKLEEITIPESVEIIGKAAFCGCKSLHKLTIKEGVKKIKGFAFANCPSLKEITIYKSIDIKESTFFEVISKSSNPNAKLSYENDDDED